MIEIRNPKLGDNRDIAIFEVYIPSIHVLLINIKMRASKSNKPYVVFPCMIEDRPDGTKRYPHLVQFGEDIEEALRKEILPRLQKLKPDVFSRFA